MTSHLITYWQALFWNPKTMWMEAPVKVQKKELSCVQIQSKLHSATEEPTTSRQITRSNCSNKKMAVAHGLGCCPNY
jgi:hypothetical protein